MLLNLSFTLLNLLAQLLFNNCHFTQILRRPAMEDEFDKIKKKIEFVKMPPPPIPGMFYMEMIPNIDIKEHSPALDQDYKSIYTPITTFFPIDILMEMKEMEKNNDSSWLKKSNNIDSTFYQEKSERNEIFMRNESKSNIDDLLDYTLFLRDSFEVVNEPIDLETLGNENIVEEYPLVPEEERFVMLTGNFDNKSKNFKIYPSDTSLIDRIECNGESYNGTKLNVDDKISIEVKNGKAIYSFIKCVYKFNKTE